MESSGEHTVDVSISADERSGGYDFAESVQRGSNTSSFVEGSTALDETLDLSASFGALDDANLQRVVPPPSTRPFQSYGGASDDFEEDLEAEDFDA